MNFPKPKITTVLICVALFFFFLLISFPFGNLRGAIFGKIYKSTGIVLVADEIYPSFFGWPGLGIKNVDVTLPMGSGDLELSCKKLIFRVGIGSLIPFAPSVSMIMKGLKKGGDLFVKFTQSKAKLDVSFDASAVSLDQLVVPGLSEPFSGTLTSSGYFSYDNADSSKSTGQMSLNAEKLKIPAQNLQGFVLPPMVIGPVDTKITIKNGIGEINKFQIGGKDSDLSGTASGEVRLAKDPISTFLNLTLRLQLSERYRQNPNADTLVSLLNSFKNVASGDYAMKWSATFADMRSNPLSAIPQPIP